MLGLSSLARHALASLRSLFSFPVRRVTVYDTVSLRRQDLRDASLARARATAASLRRASVRDTVFLDD